MTKTETIIAVAGVLLAVGAVCYWRSTSSSSSTPAPLAGGDVQTETQKDLLTALRSDRARSVYSGIAGNGATGWGA